MLIPIHITRGISILEKHPIGNKSGIKVLAEDGSVYKIHKKLTSKNHPHRKMNEVLCSYLLNIWNLNTPNVACLHTPPSILNGSSKLPAAFKNYLNKSDQAIGIKIHEQHYTFSPLGDDPHYWSYKALASPLDLIKISLWDGWIGNTGRKNTSKDLFFEMDKNKKLKIYSYNHGLTFGDIPNNFLSKNYRDKAHFSLLDLDLTKKIILMISEQQVIDTLSVYYRQAIDTSIFALPQIFQYINPIIPVSKEARSNIEDFLKNHDRNKRVFEEFASIITI
jgi:hypothetical protein